MRKEALEALEKLVSNPKLEGGQYGELMGALKKVSTSHGVLHCIVMYLFWLGSIRTKFTRILTHFPL